MNLLRRGRFCSDNADAVPTRNPDQTIPLSSSTYGAALYRWLESPDDESNTATAST